MHGGFALSPTASDLTARFPAFAGVPTDTLNAVLAEAATRVDDTWTAGDYPLGVMLYAAHVLTLDGFGTGAEAALAAAGALNFESLQAGSLRVGQQPLPRNQTASRFILQQTTYGRRFLALLNVNQPAVLVP